MCEVQLDEWLNNNCQICNVLNHYPFDEFCEGICPHYEALVDPSDEDLMDPEFYDLKPKCPMFKRNV